MARLSCADKLIREAQQLAMIDPNDTGSISRFFQAQEDAAKAKPTLGKKGMEVLYNAMLAQVYTQVAIGLETTLMNITNTVERGLASGVGLVRQGLTGSLNDAERYTAGDVLARAKGMGLSIKDRDLGLIASTQELASIWWKNFRLAHEAGQELSPSHPVRSTIGTAADAGNIEKIIGKIVRIPSSLIAGTDAMMQEVGKRASLWEQASIAYKRAGGEQGTGKSRADYLSDFVRNPNKHAMDSKQLAQAKELFRRYEEMGLADRPELDFLNDFGKKLSLFRAEAEGKKANFTSPPSETTKAVINFIDKVPFGRVIVPFINTPANIFRWVFERVPGMGLLYKDTQRELTGGKTFAEIIKRTPEGDLSKIKEYTKMDFDNVVARQTFGSSVLLAAMWLEANGYISAGPAIDPEKRTTQLEAGYEPYSFRQDDRAYKYTRPDSIGLLMGMGADFNRLLRAAQNKDEEFNQNVLDAMHAAGLMIGYNLVEKTWMSNLGLLLQAANDPERYGKRLLGQLAGMPIPAIVKHFNDAIDPEQKQMLDIIDQLKNRSGIGRGDLHQAVNITGDPKFIGQPFGPLRDVKPDDVGGKIYDFAVRMVSPYRGTDISTNPVMRTMADLGMPTKKVSDELRLFPDVKEQLTDDQYAYYAKTKGQILSVLGNRMLDNIPNWNELATELQKKVLSSILTTASQQAKNLLLVEYPALYETQAKKYVESLSKQKEPYSEPVFRK